MPGGRCASGRRRRGTSGRADGCVAAGSSASNASAIGSQSPTPSTMPMPSPPKTSVATLSGSDKRQERRDARAHRIAHDMRALDAEMVEQRCRIRGHFGRRIVGLVIALRRRTMAAIVEGDGAVAGIVQRLEPARRHPVDIVAGGKAVDHQHRIAMRPTPAGGRGRRGRSRHGKRTASTPTQPAPGVGASPLSSRRHARPGCRADSRMAQQIAIRDAVFGGRAGLELEHEAHRHAWRDDRLGERLACLIARTLPSWPTKIRSSGIGVFCIQKPTCFGSRRRTACHDRRPCPCGTSGRPRARRSVSAISMEKDLLSAFRRHDQRRRIDGKDHRLAASDRLLDAVGCPNRSRRRRPRQR